MSKRGDPPGRRAAWTGFLAAFLALVLVLALQVASLVRLERASLLAGNAVLSGFLDAVATEVLYTYGPAAERTLDVPASYFARDDVGRAAAYFRRKDLEGAKRLFVVRFGDADWGTVLFYDPETGTMTLAPASDETRAVTVACTPWKLLREKAIALDTPRLVVEERDPANRVILNPITDATSRIVGVAGLILDGDYFTSRLLPNAVRSCLPRYFPDGGDAVVVSVRDGSGALRFTTDPGGDGRADLTRPIPFVFTDHSLGVRSRTLTPEKLARVNFGFNLTLSVLVAALMAGGLVLALRATAREVKLARMKSEFVSNVTHELKTPLASIRVFAEHLRRGRAAAPEKAREYGEHIEAESLRLTNLVNNVLDLSSIESGRKAYAFAPGDVGKVLAATLAAFRVRLLHEGFDLELDEPEEPLPAARIDPDALGRAIHNLVENAVRYSGDSRWVGVRLTHRDGEIAISVEDRGIGIPESEQERIFERFHRVSTGLVHDVRGSGLGLSIVRHVVEAHGGRVEVSSRPGRGSVFTIRIPVAGVPDGPAKG
ncbi:MAG: HAMP domain-containing histidine kinase [Acidobacteriia bacterium]|nr:HAMP domain-containing histidine kinase [Terriglobia bacterium]